jgi:hypothetical protein
MIDVAVDRGALSIVLSSSRASTDNIFCVSVAGSLIDEVNESPIVRVHVVKALSAGDFTSLLSTGIVVFYIY